MTNITTRAGKGSELTHGELDANFDRDVKVRTASFFVVADDNRSVMECNHPTLPFTVTLGDSQAMVQSSDSGDYEVTILNIGAAFVTIVRNPSDLIDGKIDFIRLNQSESVTLKVNSLTNGYNSTARGLAGLTSSANELNVLDGITGTTAELNILDGATLTTAELNILDGITSTTAELNILDGFTGSANTLNNRATNFRGCLVYLDSNQILTNSASHLVNYNQTSYDTSSIHNNLINSSRLTVPAGATRVRMTSRVVFGQNTTGYRQTRIFKNGTNLYHGSTSQIVEAINGGSTEIIITTPIITVIPGDYFMNSLFQNSGGNLNVVGDLEGNQTWFSMEIIE